MKTERPTVRRVLGMVIGIVIISLGIAIFKQSHLGNDSITALNIRLSELLGISLGVQNICTNLLFLVVEFIWGRKYIGLGTLVGVAPYDSLALALQDHLHKPYFGCRVFTDALCAVLTFLLGGLVGIGTLVCAFGLGPFIQFFNGAFSEKVLQYKPVETS